MIGPDYSYLLHTYDPQKRRDYYLRNRELKGRRKGSSEVITSKKEFRKAATGNEGTYKRPQTPAARQAELKAKKEALEKRLDRLREVLAELVKDAKRRSGVKVAPEKKKAADKQSPDESSKKPKDSKLTTSEKKEKAEKARKEYQKENGGPSLSKEVAQLQQQLTTIRSKIEAARKENASKVSSKSKPKTASNGR